MNRDEATIAVRAAYKASYVLEDSVDDMSRHMNEEEHKAYRLSIGTILASIADNLLDPALGQFPDLEPSNRAEWEALRRSLFEESPRGTPQAGSVK